MTEPNHRILQDHQDPETSARMDRPIDSASVGVAAGFSFHQEVENTPDIPDAFIDQHPRSNVAQESHHRNTLQGHHHHHPTSVLSPSEAHVLLNHHTYTVGTVSSHGYDAHLYDVSGALLSEADLEGHVFHQIGEAIADADGNNIQEEEAADSKKRKYNDQHPVVEHGALRKTRQEYLEENVENNGKHIIPQNKGQHAQRNQGKERGGYTWWWRPGLIEPILEEVKKRQSYFKAVNYLKESELNHDGRYNKLASSTVESWFERGSYVSLKAQYCHHRQTLERASRPGQKSVLSKYPELHDAIKDMIEREIQHTLSHAGYHFDMKLVQQEMKRLITYYGHLEILKENGGKLTLSSKFIRRFIKKNFPNTPDPFPKRSRKVNPSSPSHHELVNLEQASLVSLNPHQA